MTPLPRTWYARDAVVVARELLGTILSVEDGGRVRRARVVETEAYVGSHDLACHAARGRTKRTETMFGPPGHAYVYFIYGMHTMLNVVTGRMGEPQAVLIRAAEPLAGAEVSLGGPGRLTRGLGIRMSHNGADLCTGPIVFEPGWAPRRLGISPRVGVTPAGPWAEAPLRFFDVASPAVSRPPRRFPASMVHEVDWAGFPPRGGDG